MKKIFFLFLLLLLMTVISASAQIAAIEDSNGVRRFPWKVIHNCTQTYSGGVATLSCSGSPSDIAYADTWNGVTTIGPTKNAIHDLITTLIGGASGATTLGTFTGSTIADNGSVKAALQALETSVEARIDVRTYLPVGYVTDGSVDYSTQVQAAIDAIEALTIKKPLLIPIPIRIGTGLTVTKGGVEIYGTRGGKLLLNAGINGITITPDTDESGDGQSSWYRVEGLEITSYSGGTGGKGIAINTSAVPLVHADLVFLEKNYIHNLNDDAIYVTQADASHGTSRLHITENYLISNTGSGIEINKGGDGIYIKRNKIYDNTGDGIYVDCVNLSVNVVIEGNTLVRNATSEITTVQVPNLQVIGNQSEQGTTTLTNASKAMVDIRGSGSNIDQALIERNLLNGNTSTQTTSTLKIGLINGAEIKGNDLRGATNGIIFSEATPPYPDAFKVYVSGNSYTSLTNRINNPPATMLRLFDDVTNASSWADPPRFPMNASKIALQFWHNVGVGETAFEIAEGASNEIILRSTRTVDSSINLIPAGAGTIQVSGTALGDLYQSKDATLTAFAGLTIADLSIIQGTGPDAFSVLTCTAADQVPIINAGASAFECATVTRKGTLTNTKWCTSDGTVVNCTENAPAGSGDITDVWSVATGNVNALTAAAGDSMDGTLADSIIPFKAGVAASLPGTCIEPMTYWATDTDTFYICTALNTWTAQITAGNVASSTLASTVTVVDSTDATSFIAMFDSATGSLAPKTDAGLTYDSTTGILMATGGFTAGPSATPTDLFSDSDAPGADKEIAKIVGAYIDGADGSENGTLSLYVHVAGTTTEYIQADGKNTVIDLLQNVVVADGKTLTFDESAGDPNDADIALSAADGVFKIASVNGANNEDITIDLDATANTATVSSASGLTDISFSALNLATTGTITGAIKISSDTNGMTSGEMTTAGLYGTMFLATGAGTWNLPGAAIGMNFCIYSTTAAAIVVNPDDADKITLNGTALANGDSITSASGAGDFICLLATGAADWITLGRSGTWTDTN